MSQTSSDFFEKLYAIRPFKETQSPPSSDKKPLPNLPEMENRPSFTFKMPEPPIFFEPMKQLTPLRKVVSQNGPSQDIQLFDTSNSKTLTSISSTIDILFSKIEKIKEEFSYALHKPQSQQQIQYGSAHRHTESLFHSQKLIKTDKENNPKSDESEKSNKYDSKRKHLNHAFSLPLNEHSQNSEIIHFFGEVSNPFLNFSQSANSYHLKISDFHLGKNIGSGKFGDVYLCIHKETGFLCAIKKIFKSTIREYGMEDQFTTQLKIHYRLNHPNIIKLYGHFDDEYHIFLMMEYASDGTLMTKLKSSEEFVSKSIDQVLDAAAYMHRNKVVHRDIKPENIVICLGETIKVCDFGWAATIQNQMKRTFCGTLDYVSPEMKDVGQYNESVDLWSIGVLTFELLAGFPPYKHEITNWKLFGSKRNMKWNWEVLYPPEINPTAEDFIWRLLKQNPNDRASIINCKSHFFIERYRPIYKGEYSYQFDQFWASQ